MIHRIFESPAGPLSPSSSTALTVAIMLSEQGVLPSQLAQGHQATFTGSLPFPLTPLGSPLHPIVGGH